MQSPIIDEHTFGQFIFKQVSRKFNGGRINFSTNEAETIHQILVSHTPKYQSHPLLHKAYENKLEENKP